MNISDIFEGIAALNAIARWLAETRNNQVQGNVNKRDSQIMTEFKEERKGGETERSIIKVLCVCQIYGARVANRNH